MKHVVIGLFLAAGVAPAGAQPATNLPAVDAVLNRHIEASGGRPAWEKISSQIRKGMAFPGAANLPLESAASAPDKWMFTIRMPNGRTIAHGFDGTGGWEQRGRAAAMDRDAILEERLIYDPFWVLRFREYFPTATVKGIEKNGDNDVYVIEAAPAGGRARLFFFDVRQGLLTRAGKTMYSDYRESGGVKVPFLVRYGYQVFQFSEIRHGQPVEEARFRMPPQAPPPPKVDTAEVSRNLPTVDQVFDKYLAAIGGEQALRKIRTQIRKGSLKEDATGTPVETFANANGKWLLALYTGGANPDREGFNGAAGWSESADVLKDMNPREQPELEMFLNFRLPLKLNSLRAGMTVKRKDKMGQREVLVVESASAQTGPRVLAFDAETGLLALADTVMFEDYRAVDGVKLPYTVKLHGGELAVAFTEIRHDDPIDDQRFERPSPSAAFEKNFAGLADARALPVVRRVIGQGVSPADGRMFYDLIVANGYKRALDIGTAEGYAALWLGLAMKRSGGRVVTIEIDPETADKARENIRQAGMEGVIDCRINDALLEIPALQGNFDFVFLDPGAPLNDRLFALLKDRISPGGAILAHNAASFKSQQPAFLKALESDPSLVTKTIPTARGGILMSVKAK